MDNKILIISASNRVKSESKRVAELIFSKLNKEDMEILDLNDYDFPFYDGSNRDEFDEILPNIQKNDAYIFIVPEWGGMIPAKFKNILLVLGQKDTGHKPVLVISVSSGYGGANPISEIKSYGYKNSKLVFIPEYVIIRKVNDFIEYTESYTKIMPRIENAYQILKEYSNSLKKIRTKNNYLLNKYPYGM